ncbi:MAG: hypothetical protein IJ008_04660 [Clostridia bacterium]|nr:hypothetical protein [Clostridia bacterium]
MKRAKSQCTLQTLHFMLDTAVPQEDAIKKVIFEVKDYKNKAGESIKIISETNLDYGSIIMEVKKKVSGYDIGNYFDE